MDDETYGSPGSDSHESADGLPQSPAGTAGLTDLPRVMLVGKQLPEAVDDAEKALRAYNDPPLLFAHGGGLARVTAGGGHGEDDAGNTVPALVRVELVELQAHLTRAARWFEVNARGVKPIFPPMPVVRDLLRRAALWAPPLRGVVRVPVFGAGWRLLAEPGYHGGEDQLYYRPDHGPLPPVAAEPTADEVGAARTLLLDELLGQFPFAAPAHRAAVAAALILPFVRHRIEGATPLHLIESPQPGTGKTLLADVLCIPALGREPPANTEIANADDARKWLTAMAVAGEPVVLIDNINARLRGAALASVLTKVEWSDRIVGTSRLARGSMRSPWLATGNNVAMTGEIARRVVRCRLDAGCAQPFLRCGFRHADLRGWAKANRPRLIWAALTLVRHWVAGGQPNGTVLLGSFESYCRTIGGVLACGGIEGFLDDLREEHRRSDEETTEWAAFVAAWHGQFAGRVVRSEDLDRDVLTPNPEMLATTLGGTAARGRRIKLGQELRERRDAVLGRHRVRVSDGVDRHGCWRYWLEAVHAVSNIDSAQATCPADG